MEKQAELGVNIKKMLVNFKKDSIERKSDVEYFDTRLAKLNMYWQEFNQNHEQLKEVQQYKESNLSAEVFCVYAETKELLLQGKQLIIASNTFPDNDSIDSKVPSQLDTRISSLEKLMAEIELENRSKQYRQMMVELLTRKWNALDAIYENSDQNQHERYDIITQNFFRLIGTLSGTDDSAKTAEHAETTVQLPKIKLPIFDGSYLRWSHFRDLFLELIHNNGTIGNAQKFIYLKSNLSGEAAKLIQHIQISENNYEMAWELLEARFSNKRLQVAVILDKLLQQPTVKNDSAPGLKMLHDTTKECLFALNNLAIKHTEWDPILHHILIKKLDANSHTLYEQSLTNPKEIQTLHSLLLFMELRFQALEAIGIKPANKTPTGSLRAHHVSSKNSTIIKQCTCCKEAHAVQECPKFLKLSPENRFKKCKVIRICINCLQSGHSSTKCTKNGCAKCGKRHNDLLHMEQNSDQQVLTSESIGSDGVIFLGTAIIFVNNKHHEKVKCRVLLDSGSQLNIMSDKCQKRLGIPCTKSNCQLGGIGSIKATTNKRASVQIFSAESGFSANINVIIMPQITSKLPAVPVKISEWQIPDNIKLADPKFNQPDEIDMLIGAEFYCTLMSIGQIKLGPKLPVLQNTILGWIVMGKSNINKNDSIDFCGVAIFDEATLNKKLEQFWSIEEVKNDSNLTQAELSVEKHFEDNTIRDNNGRFVVKLPFIAPKNSIGNSKAAAINRFLAIEKRIGMIPSIYKEYSAFMQEYLDLNHMEKVNESEITSPNYFVPHHCIIRPDKSTTKLRVVFDASAKTTNNVSLNDMMAIGPKTQDDLFDILIRFRMYKYAMTADIEKMYRQVLIHPEDRDMQLIVWRFNKGDEIGFYRLRTITYGTRPASYLATKCLQKLAADAKEKFPLASSSIIKDFYMDDLITGCDNRDQAKELRQQLNESTATAGFNLRKWCSNNQEILADVPEENCEMFFHPDADSKNNMVKTLGIGWLPGMDTLQYKAYYLDAKNITKRTIISETAQIFDPLGLVSPVIICAKIIMQELWKLKVHWDEALPQEIHSKWLKYREELFKLNRIYVPRYVTRPNFIKRELHAFSDASEKAYGVAVYVRTTELNGNIHVQLLCAKSRVAPLQATTLPRLELCAAKLMVEVVKRVQHNTNINEDATFYWCDSQIVLSWIRAESSSLKTFVANRVASIQRQSHIDNWNYVPTQENSADLVSRGCLIEELSHAWFFGPEFLKQDEQLWKKHAIESISFTGEEKQKLVLSCVQEEHFVDKINHKNSFLTLQRIVAWIIRFTRPRESIVYNELTVKEMQEAETIIFKRMQNVYYAQEIQQIQGKAGISKTSNIINLNPFLDDQGLLRVGGRIQESFLSMDEKHPIILPEKHTLSCSLLAQLHLDNMHAGPQALTAISRQRFWVINGKRLARSVVGNCVLCARARPTVTKQIMGNLPEERVRPSDCFSNVGIDFAGPFSVHYKIRGKRPTKAYVCVFVCFSTKAVHLEIVDDLSTAAFLLCLRRFISRRNRPLKIFSDNATNFVGANNELLKLAELFADENHRKEVTRFCTNLGIEWKFIPPRSPHFGGLWEAAVKSMKRHLRKVLHSAELTHPELETVVQEIEAILNSRPLTPLSADPNDLQPLTAGHFLTGRPLNTIQEPGCVEKNLAKHWSAIKAIKFEFWKRWSKEYLGELQLRAKWQKAATNMEPGQLVILKDDNTHPLEWKMARITNIFSGADGFGRVIELKTATGYTKRAIHKVCPLPIKDERIEAVEQVIQAPKTIKPGKEPSGKRRCRPIDEVYEEEVIKSTHAPQKRRLNLFTYLCIFAMAASSAGATKFNITNLKSDSGIYFENVGKGGISSNNWNFVVYYDLQNYWSEYNGFRTILNKLNSMCDLSSESAYCNAVLNEFRQKLVQIQSNNKLIFNEDLSSITPNVTRKKRGLFNFVGSVHNFLWGTLDQNYAREMDRTIQKVQSNEVHLLSLIKKQTTIIESTHNLIRKSDADIADQFRSIENEINKLIQKNNKIQLEGKFATLSVHLSLIMAAYEKIQKDILDVLLESHDGKISTALLTPEQLRTGVSKLKNYLPASLKLPGNGPQDDLIGLYKLMMVQSRVQWNRIIFVIELPLVFNEQFKIYSVNPFPIYINNEFMAIKLEADYIMVNLHFDKFYSISSSEFSKCKKIGDNYICNQKKPIKNRHANSTSCEIGMLMGHNSIVASSCKLIPARDTWLQLKNPNNWLFSLTKPHMANIVCKGEIFHIQLNQHGIVELSDDCKIQHDDIIINSHGKWVKTATATIRPTINPEILSNLTIIEEHRFKIKIKNHNKTLEELQKEINNLKKDQKLPNETLNLHDVHHYSILYALVIVIIIIIIYLKYKGNRNHKINVKSDNTFELKVSEFKALDNVTPATP